MSHPHHEHRDHLVQHRRVAKITKGYASGGAVHSDEVEDEKLIRKTVKKSALKVDGKHAKHRADRPKRKAGGRTESEHMNPRKYASREGLKEEHEHEQVHELARARGGRAKKGGKTVVNVIAGGAHPGMPSPGMAAPMPAAPAPMAPPAMPPRPPMAGPPMGGAPVPGMPPRKAGGRAYARGGAVKDGPAWNEGRRNGTQVQHTDGKSDGKNIGRGKPVTYHTGGAVEHPVHGGMAPHLPGGGGGGTARLHKAHRGKKHGRAI